VETIVEAVIAALIVASMAALSALLLRKANAKLPANENSLVERINAVLPQTQCAQCNYPGCRPYAEAIAKGTAQINQCPPGGDDGIKALAELLGKEGGCHSRRIAKNAHCDSRLLYWLRTLPAALPG